MSHLFTLEKMGAPAIAAATPEKPKRKASKPKKAKLAVDAPLVSPPKKKKAKGEPS